MVENEHVFDKNYDVLKKAYSRGQMDLAAWMMFAVKAGIFPQLLSQKDLEKAF